MNDDEKRKWAKKFLAGLKKVKEKAQSDERATAAYWNADDWGSISGIKDADEWVENQILKYVVKYASPNNRPKYAVKEKTPAVKGIDRV
jgi:hypothetical protein